MIKKDFEIVAEGVADYVASCVHIENDPVMVLESILSILNTHLSAEYPRFNANTFWKYAHEAYQDQRDIRMGV